MAFFKYNNVKISGIAAAVPTKVKEVIDQECFSSKEEAERTIALTHVERSRIAPEGMCCSDLCYEAADKLIEKLKWDRNEIEAIVYVSISRDYHAPATASLLQDRLGLTKECMAFDMPFACSGFVYGLCTIASLVETGNIKKALLLVGETTSRWQCSRDKTLWPLHGDGGTVTALEYDENAASMYFHLNNDGSRGDAIINVAGGVKHPITAEDLVEVEVEPGIFRNKIQASMDGMSVFGFAIKEPPQGIVEMCEKYSLSLDDINYLVLHQANKYIDDKIGKRLKVPKEKIPFSLQNFGNTSAASLPMTIVAGIGSKIEQENANTIMCGFGSGLSWGCCYVNLDHIVCPELIEVD